MKDNHHSYIKTAIFSGSFVFLEVIQLIIWISNVLHIYTEETLTALLECCWQCIVWRFYSPSAFTSGQIPQSWLYIICVLTFSYVHPRFEGTCGLHRDTTTDLSGGVFSCFLCGGEGRSSYFYCVWIDCLLSLVCEHGDQIDDTLKISDAKLVQLFYCSAFFWDRI